jgi:pimeloyl-ACP methyl ester carboxylesterase
MPPKSFTGLMEVRPQRKLYVNFINNDQETTLIFLHGAGGRSDQFRQQIDYFKNLYNILSFDYLGHGASEKPKPSEGENLYSFQNLYLDIETLFKQYATKKTIVIGHSYGGALASNLALHHSFDQLILLSPTTLQPKPTIGRVFYLPIFILEMFRSIINKNFAYLAFHPETDAALVEYELEMARKNPMYVMKPLVLDMLHLPKADITQLTTPTLVVTSHLDLLIPAKPTIEFYRQLPQVKFKEVDRTRHVLMVEQPQIINQIIKQCLETL